jgi:hypothetical protein
MSAGVIAMTWNEIKENRSKRLSGEIKCPEISLGKGQRLWGAASGKTFALEERIGTLHSNVMLNEDDVRRLTTWLAGLFPDEARNGLGVHDEHTHAVTSHDQPHPDTKLLWVGDEVWIEYETLHGVSLCIRSKDVVGFGMANPLGTNGECTVQYHPGGSAIMQSVQICMDAKMAMCQLAMAREAEASAKGKPCTQQ